MEVVRGFAFLSLPLMNSNIIDDFKNECKALTYIWVHHRAFGCDPYKHTDELFDHRTEERLERERESMEQFMIAVCIKSFLELWFFCPFEIMCCVFLLFVVLKLCVVCCGFFYAEIHIYGFYLSIKYKSNRLSEKFVMDGTSTKNSFSTAHDKNEMSIPQLDLVKDCHDWSWILKILSNFN